jgi:hypothetical protein
LRTFFAAVEPRYRRSFYVRDTRRAMNRRQWAAWSKGPHGDEDRAFLVADGRVLRYLDEPMVIVVWIEQCVVQWARWGRPPPAWCTKEWRTSVLEHLHLLPGSGAEQVAATMRLLSRIGRGDEASEREGEDGADSSRVVAEFCRSRCDG